MGIDELSNKLLLLKKEIEQINHKKAIAQGKKEHHMEVLKNTYKCGSIEEAKKLADDMQKDINDLEKEIEQKYQDVAQSL